LDLPLNTVFDAMLGIRSGRYRMSLRVLDKGLCENLPLSDDKSEMTEKYCLACTFGVVKRQKIIRDLILFDNGNVRVWEIHRTISNQSRSERREAKVA
jgi:hypothetical protein